LACYSTADGRGYFPKGTKGSKSKEFRYYGYPLNINKLNQDDTELQIEKMFDTSTLIKKLNDKFKIEKIDMGFVTLDLKIQRKPLWAFYAQDELGNKYYYDKHNVVVDYMGHKIVREKIVYFEEEIRWTNNIIQNEAFSIRSFYDHKLIFDFNKKSAIDCFKFCDEIQNIGYSYTYCSTKKNIGNCINYMSSNWNPVWKSISPGSPKEKLYIIVSKYKK
jgi:hypothetical protein